MNFLKNILKQSGKLFEEGKPLSWAYPVWEATDTILFSTDKQTSSGPHVRDNMDIKRVMFSVVIALIPCYLFGAYNIGYLNALATDVSRSLIDNFIFGMSYVLPVLIVTFVSGAICELSFAIIRKHEVNEGFLVTCALIPLTMPPDVPLWQVFIGTAFGIIIGKEIFGGTGFNIFNPALTARAFVFFAYPTTMSGDKVWALEGMSGATPLLKVASSSGNDPYSLLGDYSWMEMFMGFIPGSIGETSTLCVLIGAIFLIITGIGSWRTMSGVMIGMMFMTLILNQFGQLIGSTNPMLYIPPHYHFVMGSFAFGMVFMATDPVSSAHTKKGMWYYGILIGVMCVIIRAINPAYPEGMMLAILFANAFAPLFDYYVLEANVKRRKLRYGK